MVTDAQPTTGDVHIMSPSEMGGNSQQPQQSQQRPQSSLETSTDIDGAGPFIEMVRNSRYSETELLLMIDALSLLMFLYLVYKEANR